MKTRTTKATKGSITTEAEALEATNSTAPKIQLGPDVPNPPQLFVLPDDLSDEARIVSLWHARQARNTRYAICPKRGFYEFTRVAAPKTTPRSWLLSPEELDEGSNGKPRSKCRANAKGYVTRAADLFVATPIDPLFLILPALAPVPLPKDSTESKKLFLSSEDYIERIESDSPGVRGLLSRDSIRTLLEGRMAKVCDTVEAGDETMFRLDEQKLVHQLLHKAKRLTKNGLPASLEDKFVRKALEKPLLSKRRDHVIPSREITDEELPRPNSESLESETTLSSADTATRSFSGESTAATSMSGEEPEHTFLGDSTKEAPLIDAPKGVAELLRLRTALFFICSTYIQPHLTIIIKEILNRPLIQVDFAPLNTHLDHLASLRKEALASRALGDNSRKRGFDDEDEDGGEAERPSEKKLRLEDEERRRRAGESRGVKNLKKVDTTGMKKMSDFFKKR